MRKCVALLAVVLCVWCYGVDEGVRQGLVSAAESARGALSQSPLVGVPVAVLPIRGDVDGVVLGRLKNVLTAAGCVVVEGRDEPMLEELVRQIDWERRKEDLLDADTISRLGGLNCAKMLVYGCVRAVDVTAGRVYVELELHATEVPTARHVWGGAFVGRHYLGRDIQGIIVLDAEVKALLRRNFEAALASLREMEATGRLGSIRSTSVIPVAGDVDQYVTGLVTEMLTQTGLHPQSTGISTVSEVRAFHRDGKRGADAFFHGALRDLSCVPSPGQSTATEDAYQVNADIQLFLEDTRSGEILWSRTVTMQELTMRGKELSTEERLNIELLDFVRANMRRIALCVAAFFGIIALGIGIAIIRSARSVR